MRDGVGERWGRGINFDFHIMDTHVASNIWLKYNTSARFINDSTIVNKLITNVILNGVGMAVC